MYLYIINYEDVSEICCFTRVHVAQQNTGNYFSLLFNTVSSVAC